MGKKLKINELNQGENNIGSFVKHYLANVLLMLDCTSVLYYRLLFVIEVCRETDSGKSFVSFVCPFRLTTRAHSQS